MTFIKHNHDKDGNTLPSSIYTYWDGVSTSPVKFTSAKLSKFKNKICKSGAFFARKFDKTSAKKIFEAC
jgi:hypothetical protein